MNRTTKPRRVRKEPEIVYRPTGDELVRVADELVRELEFHLKVMRGDVETNASRRRDGLNGSGKLPKFGGSSSWSAATPPDSAR